MQKIAKWFVLLLFMGIISRSGIPKAWAAEDPSPSSLQNLMQTITPALVMVKIVFKTQMSAGGQSSSSEGKTETTGVVVSPDGLIMLPTNSYALDINSFFVNAGGGGDNSDFKSKTIPTEFKVTLGNDAKEYSATLVATDSILGLTFIQITNLQDKKLAAVDLSGAAQPVLGQRVILFQRLGKGYDYAPFFHTTLICGEIHIPRHAYLLDGGGMSTGLPVYDLSGKPLGILAALAPTVVETDSSGMSMEFVRRLFSGGGFSQVFLVPADSVNLVIAQAKERASKQLSTAASSSSASTSSKGTSKK